MGWHRPKTYSGIYSWELGSQALLYTAIVNACRGDRNMQLFFLFKFCHFRLNSILHKKWRNCEMNFAKRRDGPNGLRRRSRRWRELQRLVDYSFILSLKSFHNAGYSDSYTYAWFLHLYLVYISNNHIILKFRTNNYSLYQPLPLTHYCHNFIAFLKKMITVLHLLNLVFCLLTCMKFL